MYQGHRINNPALAEKIIWNDTLSNLYTPESIARRLLFLKRDENNDNEIAALLGIDRIQYLHNKNLTALLKVKEVKSLMVGNFMTKSNEIPENFDPRQDLDVAKAFGITLSEFNSIDYWRTYTNSEDYRYRNTPNYRNKFN